MSNGERPEALALAELERVLQHVKDEVASWRRRALKAEADRAEIGIDRDLVASRERVQKLEQENADMRQRLRAAGDRLDELIARLKFLEEQVGVEEQSP